MAADPHPSGRAQIRGSRRGPTPKLIADLCSRSAIEAVIGHMKADGRLLRCTFKGTICDALFAVTCGDGHNIRKILAHLRALLALIISAILTALGATDPVQRAAKTD